MNDNGLSSRSKVDLARRGRFARQMVIAVVGALALCVAVPAIASASVAWRLNGQPVSEAGAIEWSGNLKVTDSGAPGGGQSVECTDKVEGTASTLGAGEVTKLTTSKCVGVKTCQKTEELTTIIPQNLPWHTELVTVGGVTHYALVNGGKGTPGFKEECQVLKLKIYTTCSGNLSLTPTDTTGGITATFNNGEILNCTLGEGKPTGFAEGSQSVTSKSGLLSAEGAGPLWEKSTLPTEKAKPLEKAMATNWSKGTMTLVDHAFYTLGVTCEYSGSGQVGLEGAGAIEKMTFSSCVSPTESECKSEQALGVTGLPWSTNLYFGFEKAAEELVFPDGGGTPGFTIKCEAKGVKKVEAKCEAVPAIGMKNGTERGVLAVFGKVGIHCTGTPGAEGWAEMGVSSHTINLSSGETLRVS